MRVAALYDIHGNLPALRAVLADAARAGVSDFVIGGDVAAGPMPIETLDELLALAGRTWFVRGNADREVIDAYDQGSTEIGDFEDPASRSAAFAADQIARAHRDLLASFEPLVSIELDWLGPALFCHGSPRGDTDILTRITSDERLRERLHGVSESVVVCGHTHQQFDRRLDGWRVVNAGSVGIPYEGRPGAYWALLGPDVQLRRSEYDIDAGLDELRAGGFPDVEEMFRESLIEPSDPDEISRLFERQAVD